jgi:hypothetical protein
MMRSIFPCIIYYFLGSGVRSRGGSRNALPGNPSPIDSASYMDDIKFDQINRYEKEIIYHLEGVSGSGSSNDALKPGGCSRRKSDQMTHPPQCLLSVDAQLTQTRTWCLAGPSPARYRP